MKAVDPYENASAEPMAGDAAWLMRRAEQEAIAAIRAEPGPGAVLHNKLAHAYSVRAVGALVAGEAEVSASAPQPSFE